MGRFLQALFAAEQDTYSMAHYSAKKRVPLSENDLLKFDGGIPILAVIMLSPPSQSSVLDVVLDRPSPREAFIAMMKQTFQLDLSDLKRMSQHMQALGRIVPRFRFIDYPCRVTMNCSQSYAKKFWKKCCNN